MKRFFTLLFILVVFAIGIEYTFYYKGVYFKSSKEEPVSVKVQTSTEDILLQDASGQYEPWELRGVDLTSSLPGAQMTAFEVDEATYLRWFKWMQEMGANTIRVPYIMDATFYNAFYKYNLTSPEPLYLLQGITITDYANNNRQDAYQASFYNTLITQGKASVDVIHGRKDIMQKGRMNVERYRKDVSPWVLGYVLMTDWSPQTVAYTDHQDYTNTYEGTYIKTTQEATAFEALLAKVLDQVIGYETDKYNEQRLVSFMNTPTTDPFEYELSYAKQMKKYIQIDAEHLVTQPAFKSGYMASYRVYTLVDNFYKYFSDAQKQELAGAYTEGASSLAYEGYTQILRAHHTMPVVVSYSFSSSRGTEEAVPLSEKEQAQAIVESYKDFIQTGMAGVIISSWQDMWGQTTWNTSYATLSNKGHCWHDIQSANQGEGILSFEPGKEGENIWIDGDPIEWEGEKPVATSEGLELYLKYDAEGVYFLVRGEGVESGRKIYIPIDTTKRTGSTHSGYYNVTFDQPADFLLVLDGKENSRLLVQQRYESMRANYAMEVYDTDAYVRVPEKDSALFVPIYMVLKNKELTPIDIQTPDSTKQKIKFQLFETGKLHYGNGNPEDVAYDSLTDFCYGEGVIEGRIPWQLLNFSNPAFMEIHDDYYPNYGVESILFTEGHIGIGTVGTQIQMAPFTFNGWRDKLVYHERLKETFYRLQEEWKGVVD